MKTKTVNLLDLSDSQKAKVLEQAKTLLQQQLAEARLCSSVAETYKLWVKALDQKIIFTQDFHFFNHSVCGFSTGQVF